VTKAAADPLLDRASLGRLSSCYVAGQDRRDPLLSPAVTADLTGLPPVLVQVGTNEMLLDDARRLALRASDAEVDVILDITAKVPHVFQSFTGVLDEAGEALDRAALFLCQRVRGLTGKDAAGARPARPCSFRIRWLRGVAGRCPARPQVPR